MESISCSSEKSHLTCQVMLLALLMSVTGCMATRPHRDHGAPSSLIIRPPPMTADPISPDCYNFTIGNWRLQEFYSPNYPGEYINNTDCVLYLEAPSGFRIKLDFRDQFTLEKSDDCKYDFLEVRDGPFAYSPLIDRFCGAMFPPLIESTNRFLWLRFKTDDLLQYGGFRAIYSYHKDHTQNDGTSLSKVTSTVCRIPVKLSPDNPDGVLSSEEVPFGDVSDPNYPRKRPVDCTWEIYTDQGNSINVHALKMQRGNNVRCDYSYVSLYQGTTLDTDRQARLCGNDDPEVTSVTSQANRVFVRVYGRTLNTKPDVEMVYSLVKTGDACVEGFLSCGDFCVSSYVRCNGVANCPDGRDERGCGQDSYGGGAGDGGTTGQKGGGGRRQGTGGGGNEGSSGRDGQSTDSEDDTAKDSEGGKIPMHMIVLGAVGGVLLTSVLLGLCIMCRSRRSQRGKKRQEMKLSEQEQQQRGKRGGTMEMAGTPTSQAQHPTHSLSRHHPQYQGQGDKGKGQGQAQGRYMTFAAHVTPTPKDGSNRYSFTGSGLPSSEFVGGGDPSIVGGGDLGLDPSGQYRRFLAMEINPDDYIDGGGYPSSPSSPVPAMYTTTAATTTTTPQGVVIGMTHLPSSPTYSSANPPTTTVLPPSSHSPMGDAGGVYKYPSQWGRGMMMEDPGLVYPYTASLPRPTPFLGLSKPILAESKYLKSMQALKVMDEEIMKESPAS